jgi:hypothetical protein
MSTLFRAFKRHEVEVVAAVIGVVFVAAMGIVAWALRSSLVTPPYEALGTPELGRVFATGNLRFREDDGTPYLKVEVHNGTLWWIKNLEFEFDGELHTLSDSDAFRPLQLGALRCLLKRPPENSGQIEFDLKVVRAYGYPPARVHWDQARKRAATEPRSEAGRN